MCGIQREADGDDDEIALNNKHCILGLEDKASACDMLVCYARELKEAFAEYAEDVVKLMVPMLKFYFHDNVRTAAAESLPYLLECARIRGPQYIQGMWAYILPELLKAIDSEPEQEVQVELLNSLAKVTKMSIIYKKNCFCKLFYTNLPNFCSV